MSLQVWLPLTKDLRQQGLSNVTITNNGATFNSAGKLGGCYQFNASGYLKETSFNWTNFNTSEFSLCCWYKEPSPVASGNSQMICIGTSSGWNNIRIGLLRRTSNGYPMFSVSDGTNNVNYNFTADSFTLDTWNHIVCTYNHGTMKMYLNGILHKTATTTIVPVLNSSQHLGIGAASNGSEPLTGYLNDVRIYDHCLSQAEVKELAKGLVLHYPLNGGGFGQENLLSGNNAKITTWTNYMPNSVTLSGDGYDNKYTLIEGIGGWEKIFTEPISVISGQDYTLSFDYSVEQNYRGYSGQFGLAICTSSQAQYGNDTNVITKVNFGLTQKKKSRTSVTFTAPDNVIYLVANGGCIEDGQTNISFYISYLKLEKGSIATPWCPNSSDALATVMGVNSTIEYDCSGYCNNGTRTGTFIYSSDTPKYAVSTQFNGTQIIQLPFSCGTISEAITIACWGYESNWNTSSAERLIGAATNSSGWCIGDYGSENTLFAFYANGSYNIATGFKQLTAGWHYFVITFDGLNLKYYIDGQQLSNKTFSIKQVAVGNYNIEIGRHYGDGCNFKGRMSDVRIYATALSAEDILELYHTAARIDNVGNTYVYQYIET